LVKQEARILKVRIDHLVEAEISVNWLGIFLSFWPCIMA
jgi:hypothetical protein